MTTSADESTVHDLVEHFFRHESGKILSHLTRVFGTSNLETVEDAVQEALYKAMKVWAYHGPPSNPSGWIMRVAKNKVIDTLRLKGSRVEEFNTEVQSGDPAFASPEEQTRLETEFRDDQLGLFFACCDPSLTRESQIILTLKLLCGFSKQEIARALLKKEDAVAKAFTRAKARLKENGDELVVPQGPELQQRLEVVLKVLYLTFNEGYKASEGDNLIREDLCIEAIRLCQMLLENKLCEKPEVHALLALMLFQSSRLKARTNEAGELIPFEQQDRSRWNTEMIRLGTQHMALGAHGVYLSDYHLQASIAAFYSTAKSYEETDWKMILKLYDIQLTSNASPIIALNRIVSFSRVHGPEAALAELDQLQHEKVLQTYHLNYAIRADLLTRLNRNQEAAEALEKAVTLTRNQSEILYLRKKFEALEIAGS